MISEMDDGAERNLLNDQERGNMRLNKLILIISAVLLAAACGGAGQEGAAEPVEVPETAETAESPEAVIEETPVEIVEETVLYPEGTLDPELITVETPVTARALFQAYFAWEGRQVTVSGYPYIPYLRDSAIVGTELELIADPESSERSVTAIFTDSSGITVMNGELIAITGVIEMSWTGDMEIIDAVFVDPPAMLERVETSPYACDGVTPIPVDQMFEMVSAWMNKEVVVEGYYNSTTTSTTSYGTTIRVDLSHPDDTYTKFVACEMAVEIPATTDSLMVADREGVLIRGVIKGESFDLVGLEGCEVLNR